MENYERDSHRRRFDWLHAKLIDLDRALVLLRTLQPKAYAVVLVVGMMQVDLRTAGNILGTSKDTVARRYDHALKTMTHYLNSGRTR